MGMKMCRRCHSAHKKNGWYLNGQEEIVKQDDCSIHPSLDNWRVQRTLRTLMVWGADDGYEISVDRGQKMVVGLEDGWIHLRTAFLKLFDYERPFVDILIKEGMLEQRECIRGVNGVQPKSVRVTMRGTVWLKEIQLRKEAEKQLEDKIEIERALS